VNPTSLASWLSDHPFDDDEVLVSTPARTTTAGQVRREAVELAGRLRSVGVTAGNAVAVQLPNDERFVVAMFAVWQVEAVFVPLNARMPESERATALDATRPAVLVTTAGIEPVGVARRYEPDAAFVLWTSGTTGRPKPIVHTHTAYAELIDRVLGPLRTRQESPAKPPSPNLIPVSLSLNAGLYNVLFGLRAGAGLVIMDAFEPMQFADLITTHSIRSSVLPPAAIAMLNDAADAGIVTDLTPLRYVRSITAPLSTLQARRFSARFGVTILNGYGQAEIGEVIGWTAADAREHPEKVGAVGRPHPGVQISIVEADNQGIGRLLVKPPSMASGYATGDDLRGRLDADGYVDTGDLARIDDHGFVWIEGRVNDLINRGGNKVFPEHVEEVLRLLPGVREAAVVGRPDERLGEVPVAFVVCESDESPTDDELRLGCREHLVPYKIPVAFHRVANLPRNEVGKLLRRALVDQLDATKGSA
jgi:long-chain acyl-CoA synthetase